MKVNRAGALAAFADRPDDKALPAPHVTAQANTPSWLVLIFDDIGFHIATWVEFDFGLVKHSGLARAGEAHGEERSGQP
jgi:hypothetical protein